MTTYLAIHNKNKVIEQIIVFENKTALQDFTNNIIHNYYFEYNPLDFNLGINWTYDNEYKKFIPEKLNDSWILNNAATEWIPPVPKPNKEPLGEWFWHEDNKSWVDIVTPLED